VNGNSTSFWTSLRGPIMMITLGTLFALEYSGGPNFTRTWPVLVIVFGFFKLAEYLGAQKA